MQRQIKKKKKRRERENDCGENERGNRREGEMKTEGQRKHKCCWRELRNGRGRDGWGGGWGEGAALKRLKFIANNCS